MKFTPIKERCLKCNSEISCDIEIKPGRPRFERVSDWVCDKGHIVENEELLERLKEDVKSFNLTAP